METQLHRPMLRERRETRCGTRWKERGSRLSWRCNCTFSRTLIRSVHSGHIVSIHHDDYKHCDLPRSQDKEGKNEERENRWIPMSNSNISSCPTELNPESYKNQRVLSDMWPSHTSHLHLLLPVLSCLSCSPEFVEHMLGRWMHTMFIFRIKQCWADCNPHIS